jgi:hypothetical protein
MSKMHLLSLASLAALSVSASAQVIDFEDVANNGVGGFTLHGDVVNSGGYTFASTTLPGATDAIASWTADIGSFYTGSVAIFANYNTDSLMMTQVGGGAFSVTSIGVADVFCQPTNLLITLIGTLPDFSTVQEQFNLTDGSSMQSYAVNSMNGIISMEIIGQDGFQEPQIDNVVVAVPEPGTFVAVGVGLIALLARRSRR